MHPSSDRYTIQQIQDCVHVHFVVAHRVLSSAVLNGGLVDAEHIVNLNVEKNPDSTQQQFEPAAVTLKKYCRRMAWKGVTVGMMTAAGLGSFRKVRRVEQGVEVEALITAGVSNARRAGDPADCRKLSSAALETGTINIIILTNARLTPAAMVEAVLTVTEAKSAALQNMDIRNPVTGSIATGTGTDAIAIASGLGPAKIAYCGKHMLFGEMLASTVINGITSSIGGASLLKDPL